MRLVRFGEARTGILFQVGALDSDPLRAEH
jgi:hypothetical protein